MIELNLVDYDLDQIKGIVQEIIDKYLSLEDRFSVEEWDENTLAQLIALLLEKTAEKRDDLWQELNKKQQSSSEKLKHLSQELLEIYNQLKITGQLGDALNELKSAILNQHSLSQIEQKIGL